VSAKRNSGIDSHEREKTCKAPAEDPSIDAPVSPLDVACGITTIWVLSFVCANGAPVSPPYVACGTNGNRKAIVEATIRHDGRSQECDKAQECEAQEWQSTSTGQLEECNPDPRESQMGRTKEWQREIDASKRQVRYACPEGRRSLRKQREYDVVLEWTAPYEWCGDTDTLERHSINNDPEETPSSTGRNSVNNTYGAT